MNATFPLSSYDRNRGKYTIVTEQGNLYATTYDPAARDAILAIPDMLSALRLGLNFVIEQRNAGLDVDHEFDILTSAIQQATQP
jgi:hypothetical protein